MVTNKIKFLDNKTNYFLSIFLLAYTIFISHYFYSYIDWSGDYSLYIMQAKALSNNSVNILLEKMQISLGLSPNSNPYTPSHYPWGFPTILALTSFLHKWNLFFIKLMNPIAVLLIALFFIKILRKNNNKNFLIPLLACILPNNLLFYSNLQPSILSSLFIILSFYYFDDKKENKAVLFFVTACLIRTNSIFFFIYFILNSKFKENLSFIFKLSLSFLSLFSFFRIIFGISIFGNYEVTPIFQQSQNLFEFTTFYNSSVDFLIKTGELIFFNSYKFSTYLGFVIFIFLIFLSFKKLDYFTILFFALATFIVNYFLYPLDIKRILTPIIFVSLFMISKNKINIYTNVCLSVFIIFNLFILFPSIKDIDRSDSISSQSFQNISEIIYDKYSEYPIAFHKPRILMMKYDVISYKINNENFTDLKTNSIILCDLNFNNCPDLKIYNSVKLLEKDDNFELLQIGD